MADTFLCVPVFVHCGGRCILTNITYYILAVNAARPIQYVVFVCVVCGFFVVLVLFLRWIYTAPHNTAQYNLQAHLYVYMKIFLFLDIQHNHIIVDTIDCHHTIPKQRNRSANQHHLQQARALASFRAQLLLYLATYARTSLWAI